MIESTHCLLPIIGCHRILNYEDWSVPFRGSHKIKKLTEFFTDLETFVDSRKIINYDYSSVHIKDSQMKTKK